MLWLLAALTLIAASVAANSRQGVRAASDNRTMASSEALCDGAIVRALAVMVAEGGDPGVGHEFEFRLADVPVGVSIVPANAYINVNTADEPLLVRLFQHGAGLDPSRALQLARRVMDWRDSDDEALPDGAEAPDYVAAGVSFRPRNGRFETIDDLMQVLGLDFLVFDRIRSLVVAGGRDAQVNALAASPRVLTVLADGDDRVARAIVETRRERGRSTDLSALPRAYVGDSPTRVMRVDARIVLPDQRTIVRTQWIVLGGAGGQLPWLQLSREPARFGSGA
ncbi:MAG: general secretion pathway protein GspK [Rhodocyclaceae bacterium]|nr:general secretion pathway protein GspK [Rhodocyclaceae bacterium]